jgi:nucleoside 2-deoxyribosyltransferase
MDLYLASPLGFSECGTAFYYGAVIPAIIKGGFGVLDPWKLTDQRKIDAVLAMPYGQAKRDAWEILNVEIGGNNRAAIDRCSGVFAVLDGTDVDSGTAAEIGYASARSKPVLGYRGDFRIAADNEGATVNLQVQYFIAHGGGEIIRTLDDLPAALSRLKAHIARSGG